MKKNIRSTSLTCLAAFATISLFASFSMFTSCSKKAQIRPVNIQPLVYQNDNVTVEVDPKLELIMIALRLAEIEPFCNNYYGQDYSQYLDGVDKLFQKQKEHPLVKELKARCKNYKKSYAPVIQISRYISEDMTKINIKSKELPEEMQDFWKGVNLKSFIAQFNDFAVSSNFERLWLVYLPQLKNQAISVQEYYRYNQKVTDWISSYYFDKNHKPEYKLHSTITSGGVAFLPSPIYEGDKVIFQVLAPAYFTKDYEWNPIQDAINYSACLIFYLIKKNWELLSADATRIIEDIYSKNQLTEKVTKDVVQSQLVTTIALACLFDFDKIKENEEFRTSLYNAITTQLLIQDPDKVIGLAEHYQNNRDQYPDFASFVTNYLPGALKDF